MRIRKATTQDAEKLMLFSRAMAEELGFTPPSKETALQGILTPLQNPAHGFFIVS